MRSSFRTCDLLGWSETCCLSALLWFWSSILGRITCLLVKQGTGILLFTSLTSLPSPIKEHSFLKIFKAKLYITFITKDIKSLADMISIPNKITIIFSFTYADGSPRQGCQKWIGCKILCVFSNVKCQTMLFFSLFWFFGLNNC